MIKNMSLLLLFLVRNEVKNMIFGVLGSVILSVCMCIMYFGMSSEVREIKKKMDEIESKNEDFRGLSGEKLVADEVKSDKIGVYGGKK